MSARRALLPAPDRLLHWSVKGWFAVAAAGMAVFAIYTLLFFVPATLTGDFAAWDRNTMMQYGYIEGDRTGNLQFAAHVMVAGFMTLAGMGQMLPVVRRRWPAIHRWSGRIFVATASVAAVSGLLMKWFRAPVVADMQNAFISFNAVLILVMAWLTITFAIRRDFERHQRWAVRLWLVASGVWFIRVGIMAWGLVHTALGGSEGPMAPNFELVAAASYLLPWAIYEACQWAERRGNDLARLVMAAVISLCAALTLVGVAGASMVFWLPLLLVR